MTSAVFSLVEKLAKLAEKEVKLLKGVREEIAFIKREFEHIKAFLASAESSQEDDLELKVWVKDIIEVAYDTEDILDEFTLKLARDHGHGFTGYLRKIKSSIQNLKARHHISSKIADIKSRVSNIGEGHQRYHFKSYCTEQSVSTFTGGTSWHDLREGAFLVDEGELVGIDEPREEIVKWLVDEEPRLEVVSILGMGGLGKTTLAGQAYNNQQVKAYFQSHAWINVSQSYKIEDILRDMIVQLHNEFEQPIPQGIEIMRSMSLKQMVKDFLQQKRYVIVLDDLWDKEALEGVFPEDHVIECARLIRLWIAEGFVEEREGMTQEEVAQRYLKELINKSLISHLLDHFVLLRDFRLPRHWSIGSTAKLCYVKAGGDRSKNTMQELGELCQLRRLGVMDLKKDDAKELCHSLKKMTDLRSLVVVAESEYESAFEMEQIKIEPLIALQNLPNLVELELDNAFDGEKLVFEDRGFLKLKQLSLANLENLRFVLMNGQAMPCLQSLFIYKCKHLDWQLLLVVIHNLTILKYLQFREIPEEFALAFYPYSSSKMMREGIMQKCYEEVMERNPKVYFVWWEEDHWELYDLSLDSYNAIKGKVMSCGDVLPKVS
ncbi:disease resistance protein RPM1-like [Eucalyptus grandis]|uniref:disease resistance protein RPM1-like n=1 Tax=Eucalyptus grandis TaxID=71139 RepID=UPI00192F0172|nr:disease resistance protein RPM1-like [Eucalyptus grandis]